MHSIIITHRQRQAHLRLALWSIRRSATICRASPYEIVVVHNGPDDPPRTGPNLRVIVDDCPMPIFNRSRLINLGIAAAGTVARPDQIREGMQERWPRYDGVALSPDRQATDDDVLTVLDADAVVGPRWFDGARHLRRRSLIRICYRVRWLTSAGAGLLASDWPPPNGLHDRLFALSDIFPPVADTFGSGEITTVPTSTIGRIHGNSQLSIRRGSLGDLRFDEGFVGWGSEDMDFNRRLVARHGPDYSALLDTRGSRSILFLPHAYDASWRNDSQAAANYDRYLAGTGRMPTHDYGMSTPGCPANRDGTSSGSGGSVSRRSAAALKVPAS